MNLGRKFVYVTVFWTVFTSFSLVVYMWRRTTNDTQSATVSTNSVAVDEQEKLHTRKVEFALPVNKTAETMAVQERRQRLLAETCRKLGLGAGRPSYRKSLVGRNMLVNDDRKYIYCVVGKVASSTWKQVLIVGTGKVKENRSQDITWGQDGRRTMRYLRKMAEFSPSSIAHRLKTYYKFMFVRHPLERTLSAFRDKFRHQVNYMRYYGARIVRRYRGKNATETSLRRGNDVTLSEYVKFLLDPKMSRSTQTDRRDIHWAGQWELCRPCSIKYDFIGHYETLDDDGDCLVEQLHLDPKARFPHQVDASGRPKKRRVVHDDDFREAFSEIPSADFDELKRLYSNDYQLFGYS